MPRLPSVADMERPTPRPQGGIASYRPAAGEGGEWAAVAQVSAQVADTMGEIDTKLTNSRRAAQLNDAVGQATGALGELEIKYRRDQDFKTSANRFSQDADLIRQKLDAGIDDSVVKAAFAQRFGELATTKRLNVVTQAAKQEGDFHVSALDSNLDLYATAAANASNPAERAVVQSQADIAITEMRQAGWITDIDAGVRRRGFFAKVDQAIVTRDMSTNAFDTAQRLATDAKYAPGLDLVARERLIDAGFRRSETERARQEAEIKRMRQERGDEGMKNAWDALAQRKLTPAMVEALRNDVSPSEYKGLKDALRKQGGTDEDGMTAYAQLQGLLYPPGGGAPDVEDVRRTAFAFHANGQIKDSTLAAILSKSRELARSEGPRSPYERNRALIVTSLEPGPNSMDYAPKARQGLAVKEFDDWFSSRTKNPPTDKEIDAKATEIVKRIGLVDMQEMAKKTSMGQTANPEAILQRAAERQKKLSADLEAGRISKGEFDRQSADLNKLRKSAERAGGGQQQ